MKLKAYNGDTDLKTTMVAEAIKHREHDSLVQGFGYGNDTGETFRGCAVGCTIRTINLKKGKDIGFSDHSAYERELGVPRILAKLEDGIFEGLPKKEAMTWPEQFLAAIPVGADLSRVGDQFLHWLLVDPTDGVIKYAKTDEQKKAIQNVGDLFAKKLAGEVVTKDEWWAARSSADDAAAYAAAAYAADDAAAADAAAADAYAAAAADAYAAAYAYADAAYADAAAYAAYAAAYAAAAAAAAAARKKARVRQAEKLLELMAAAPVETLAT